ncbi:hypothetical protein C2845_PM17G13170 [Panicum miliaceum]|uniref:KIB1-4 beta-propeller domain-containing protein n=1 Tax=Panicum miliaceum TaxID=4540 RepID=A0A3L6Q2D1_PANMI|nr:hypothetical protein C2845_PM17G13170 [Panicum miliaceum]
MEGGQWGRLVSGGGEKEKGWRGLLTGQGSAAASRPCGSGRSRGVRCGWDGQLLGWATGRLSWADTAGRVVASGHGGLIAAPKQEIESDPNSSGGRGRFSLEDTMKKRTRSAMIERTQDRSEHHGRLAEQAGFYGELVAVLVGPPAGARGLLVVVLVGPPAGARSLPDGEPHSFPLGEGTLCAGSSGCGGWVLFRQPWSPSPSRRLFLRNPLLGTTKWLPGYCREPVDLNHPYGSGRPGYTSTRFSISKVIVCPGDLIAARVSYQQGPCAVACCRPGMVSWSAGLCNGRRYKDMALYKGKLYTVTDYGSLFAHEVTEVAGNSKPPRVSRIEQVIQAPLFPLEHMLDGPYRTLDCVKTC